jgi:hypothetical protein
MHLFDKAFLTQKTFRPDAELNGQFREEAFAFMGVHAVKPTGKCKNW